ncbi:iron dependent repressor, metal binding and dimerization domain protein [Faecalibaculum rodentium]|nr:iron dependent repressor, metal binding and dimerization domain protein [Faecalibaculum rodentium]
MAQEDACRMEHVVSQETFDAIRRYFDNNKEAGE